MVNRCTSATHAFTTRPDSHNLFMTIPTPPRLSNISAIYRADATSRFSRPVLLTRVPAGFPSPAEQYFEGRLDLNRHVVRRPTSTFFIKVEGDSMEGEGIFAGDLLIVDRAEEPRDGAIVVARVGNDYCVKKLRIEADRVSLCSANPAYAPIEITDETDWEVWGCVTYSFRKH